MSASARRARAAWSGAAAAAGAAATRARAASVRCIAATSREGSERNPGLRQSRHAVASPSAVAFQAPRFQFRRGGGFPARNDGGWHGRNIRPLFNFEPAATDDEIRAAAVQFVRKISGYTHPSQANATAFDRAVDEVASASRRLLASLVTHSGPRDREVEAGKARERSRLRYAR